MIEFGFNLDTMRKGVEVYNIDNKTKEIREFNQSKDEFEKTKTALEKASFNPEPKIIQAMINDAKANIGPPQIKGNNLLTQEYFMLCW